MSFLRLLPLLMSVPVLVACAKAVKQAHDNTRPLSSLAGSEWGFDGVDGPFVQFRAKGEVSGSGGCNNFFGTYEQNGDRLILGPLASTKKACIGPAMETERQFLSSLQNAHHVEATHLRLKVFAEDGSELLSLVRRDWD